MLLPSLKITKRTANNQWVSMILTKEDVVAHIVQVGESDLHSFHVTSLVILKVVLFQKGLHSWRNHRMTELRHGREQVVFDLEVEVTHPPVDELERSWLDVHRVDGSVADPVSLQ